MPEIIFMVRLSGYSFVCVPKAGFGHTYKISASNSHTNNDLQSRNAEEYFGETSYTNALFKHNMYC